MLGDELFSKEKQLFMLLDRSRDPKYYSYSLDSILSEMKIDQSKLIQIGKGLQNKLGDDYKLNIFEWSDVNEKTSVVKTYTFVGFEYRRKDYERDKLLGVNKVEDNIKKGIYS